ncbi:MAG: peptidoglycan-binding protein [Clostridia bacterium]
MRKKRFNLNIGTFLKKLRLFFKKLNLFYRRLTTRGKIVFSSMFLLLAAGIILPIALRSKAAQPQTLDIAPGDPAAYAATVANIIDITPPPVPTIAPTPTPTPDPTLRKGDESEEVTKLQERLIALGYLELDEPTQLFGPATQDAVRKFQRQVSFNSSEQMQQDGVAGLITLNLIYADDAPKYTVKEGMRGEDITIMQQQLVDLGYMKAVTGYYGEQTVAAIKSFQSTNRLSADGLAGEKTVDLLYSPEAKMSPDKRAAARVKANIDKMLKTASANLGKKYILGHTGPNSFDCSGLVYYCLKQAGSNRTRYNAAGYSRVSDWDKLSDINKLKKGDLIFFYDDAFTKVGHVGIVISGSTMIDASSGNGKVVRRSYLTPYWKKHFVCGRRPW